MDLPGFPFDQLDHSRGSLAYGYSEVPAVAVFLQEDSLLLGPGTHPCKANDLEGTPGPLPFLLPSPKYCASIALLLSWLHMGHRSTWASIGSIAVLSSCGGRPQHHSWVSPALSAPPPQQALGFREGSSDPGLAWRHWGSVEGLGVLRDRVPGSLSVTQVEHLGIAEPVPPACNQIPLWCPPPAS